MTEVTTETTVETQTDSLITDDTPKPLDFTLGKPEGFPDDFWDADKKAPATDKLYKSWETEKKRADGLRVKLSKGEFEGKAPDDIKEYALELSDELKPLVPDDDPMYNAARQAAKDAGLPKEAFSKFMLPVITKLAELKAQSEVGSSAEELEADRALEIGKLGPNGSRVVEAVGSFIKQLQAGGTFNEAEANTAKAMANSADAVRVLNKLRMMAGDSRQVPVDIPVESGASRTEVEAKRAAAMLAGNETEYSKYSAMLARISG